MRLFSQNCTQSFILFPPRDPDHRFDNLQTFLANSIALSFSNLATLAADFDPRLPDLIGTLVVVGLNSLHHLTQSRSVAGLDLGDGHTAGSFAPSHTTKSGLVLDNAVGYTHLAAQSGQEQNKLDRVNIISNND